MVFFNSVIDINPKDILNHSVTVLIVKTLISNTVTINVAIKNVEQDYVASRLLNVIADMDSVAVRDVFDSVTLAFTVEDKIIVAEKVDELEVNNSVMAVERITGVTIVHVYIKKDLRDILKSVMTYRHSVIVVGNSDVFEMDHVIKN